MKSTPHNLIRIEIIFHSLNTHFLVRLKVVFEAVTCKGGIPLNKTSYLKYSCRTLYLRRICEGGG